MKLVNDVLGSSGLHIAPLLKIINEYAWQTYVETDLKPIFAVLKDYYDVMNAHCDVTPRLLNATIQATKDSRDSILFRRTENDGHMACLRRYVIDHWRLKWSSKSLSKNCLLTYASR